MIGCASNGSASRRADDSSPVIHGLGLPQRISCERMRRPLNNKPLDIKKGNEPMSDIIRHNPDKRLSDAVEYNGLVFLAGQVAENCSVGMKAQTEDVLRQIDALLAKCGTNKSRILSATVYVADMKLKPQMDEAWLAWVDQKNPPARATVEVALGTHDTLVEIVCVAAK